MTNVLAKDWYYLLKDEFKKDYFFNLRNFLNNEYKHHIIHPDKENIFNSGSGRDGLFTAHESGCTTCDKGHCTAGVVHGCRTDAPAFGADLPQGCIRDIALER